MSKCNTFPVLMTADAVETGRLYNHSETSEAPRTIIVTFNTLA